MSSQKAGSINIRQIVYKALVEKVGVDSALMSRVDSDSPICISLENEQEIFVDADNEKQGVFVFSEVDVRDTKRLHLKMKEKAGDVMELLMASRHVSLKFTETGAFLLGMYSGEELSSTKFDISTDLSIINGLVELVVEGGGVAAKGQPKPAAKTSAAAKGAFGGPAGGAGRGLLSPKM